MIIFGIIISAYLLWMFWIVSGLENYKKTTPITNNVHSFSIIIPFKNEAENLAMLLNSLQQLDYDAEKFEILLINDYSDDDSIEILKKHPFKGYKLLSNRLNPSKKGALLTGIKQAKFPWIVTTDADCEVPVYWLQSFDTLIGQQKPLMILAPVKFRDKLRFLQQFQQVEFMALQAITVAGVYWRKAFLSNGANLCFDKKTFFDLKTYEGNMQIISGDDVFLLEKFQRNHPGRISYAKTALSVVKTACQKTPYNLIQQKIRWAGKMKFYHSALPYISGGIIFAGNLFLIPAIYLSFQNINYLFFPLIKFFSDILLLLRTKKFIPFKFNFFYFIAIFLIYPLYYLFILLMSFKGTYHWKGKRYQA